MLDRYQIIDISQPVNSRTACFPGDVPFKREITVSYQQSKVINLTALTMSPHVGTHADAPIHVFGDMDSGVDTIGFAPLDPYLGPCVVIDLAGRKEGIEVSHIRKKLERFKEFPKRVLFRTCQEIRYEVFESEYAYFSPGLISYLSSHGAVLAGIDTPSVDHVSSKTLPAHHELISSRMFWLENLDLTRAREGSYFLIALPLKLMELEASPVRAVLLGKDYL